MTPIGSQDPELRGEDIRVTTPTLELLAGLAELHKALATADTEDQSRAAVARHLERWHATSGITEMLAELQALHGLTDQMNATTTLDELLRVVTGRAFAEGAYFATLSTIEVDASGNPEWLTHTSVVGEPALAAHLTGNRSYLPSWPSAKLWINDRESPFLTTDVQSDTRVDPLTRASFAQPGVRGLACLPLAVRDRWIGVILIAWKDAHAFSELDSRIYQGLCRKVAMIVENRLLFARAEEALQGTQRQRILLETILEHMTVGVVLANAQTGEVLLMNRRVVSLMQFDSAKTGAPETFARQAFVPGTDVELRSSEWPMARSIATRERVEAEHDILRPDGTRVTLSVIATPVLDEKGDMAKCLVLLTDITDRRRAESERLKMQEELIRAQAVALAERSTPLIPISRDIVVMPVIGSIDIARGQEMMAVLLEGASRARARFAILDITGARMVDAPAASAILGAARALRLLGIEPVLTGVRPEVAQTLVSLGLDLGDIVTRGTLESGIAHANQRIGRGSSRA